MTLTGISNKNATVAGILEKCQVGNPPSSPFKTLFIYTPSKQPISNEINFAEHEYYLNSPNYRVCYATGA